tara:strand:+ start:549 stop:764 length:216 start_codon:yes stop_codon:yes gene_type:complete
VYFVAAKANICGSSGVVLVNTTLPTLFGHLAPILRRTIPRLFTLRRIFDTLPIVCAAPLLCGLCRLAFLAL